MNFSGPDLMVSKFQVDAIVVSRNVFAREVLERAASRLLSAWPALSLRTNLTNVVTWRDRLRPRVFIIQAVVLRDATVFKFTIQHAAGDALSLYNAASAFCEGLRADIADRSADSTKEKYRLAQLHDVPSRTQDQKHGGRNVLSLHTSQAREWWKVCTGNKLFPIVTLARKWNTTMRHASQWQTIHFPQSIVENWRAIARNAVARVSTFDFVASWIHLNLAEFARGLDANTAERFAVTVNVSKFLEHSQDAEAELGNPFSIAVVSSFPQTPMSKQDKLLHGALNIRKHVEEIRDPTYMRDYAALMSNSPQRQCQIRGTGSRLPASLLLTSWSYAPFPNLQTWSTSEHAQEPVFVQPVIACLPYLPLPEKYFQDRHVGIVWEGRNKDGYWFTAHLEDGLWRKVLETSLATA